MTPVSDLRWTCECSCPCLVLVEFSHEQMTKDLNLLCLDCLNGSHGQDDDRRFGDERRTMGSAA